MTDTKPWPRPEVVQWMATLRCPHACKHCMVHTDCVTEDMTLKQVNAVITEVHDMGVPQFLVTGGEPMVREDLTEVIASLKRLGQRWTLNTAVLPNSALRRALEDAPPAFVALSLDGTREVHDRFRRRIGSYDETLEAISFYQSIGSDVGVGTTVSQHNVKTLDPLLEVVKASGVGAWGLHFPVPEGRAAHDKTMNLSHRQVRRLYDWVIRTRKEFSVELTDSFGSCGSREPLVRNAPVRCGAGTKQCVILPGGEIVPCLTVDRSTSTGNVLDRPLREIWNDGFGELREWRPKSACASCGKGERCRNACWVMRKNGHGCLQAESHRSGLLKTAVGIVASACAMQPTTGKAKETPASYDMHVARWYASQTMDSKKASKLVEMIKDKESYSFLVKTKDGKLPTDLTDMCTLIGKELEGDNQPLAAIALMWRGLVKVSMDKAPKDRTHDERKSMIKTLAKLKKEYGHACRRERQDSINRNVFIHRPERFAAMHCAPNPRIAQAKLVKFDVIIPLTKGSAGFNLQSDVVKERANRNELSPMALAITFDESQNLRYVGPTRLSSVSSGDMVSIFDLIHVPKGGAVFRLAPFDGGDPLEVKAPGDMELTYVDLISLAGQQHADALVKAVKKECIQTGETPVNLDNPLLFHSVRTALKTQRFADKPLTDSEKKKLKQWMIDFWMF